MPHLTPAIFFGHGNPMNAVLRNSYTEAWGEMGREIARPRAILSIVVQDEIPEFQIVIHGIEFELAILKPDSPRALLARGVESIEIGLRECH